jgi:hypothetical protein
MTDDEYIRMKTEEHPHFREQDFLLTFLASLAVSAVVVGFIALLYMGAPL